MIAAGSVPELIPVLGSQPAGDVSHKPGVRPTDGPVETLCVRVGRQSVCVRVCEAVVADV